MINTQTTKDCLQIIETFVSKEKAIEMLNQLAKVKGNQSFKDSVRRILDLAVQQFVKQGDDSNE